MALSVLTAFAKFLGENQYTTSMWENGYNSDEVNEVCHALTTWAQRVLDVTGEFLILWSSCNDTQFSGDNELIYAVDGAGYLIPNPFLEGDSEGFVTALQRILHDGLDELYTVEIHSRILYNAA